MTWPHNVGPSSAHVDLDVANNETMFQAFQFDPWPSGFTGATGVTGPQWNFDNKNFRLDIKPNHEQAVLLSLTSVAGEIVVDDSAFRILHFNVPDTVLSAALIPGRYIYDFIMYDNSVPPVRVQLMHGHFDVTDGVTGD
jgi:hypothetical protein